MLFRPQTGHYRDVVEEAATMFRSLVQNHPLVDGNERTAFAAADVFLRMNGIVLDIEAYELIVGSLEQGRPDFERIDPMAT